MLLEALIKKYPQGSYGGECAVWAETILKFGPVGDTIQQKKAFVSQNGDCITVANLYGNFLVGDVLFTTEGTWLGLYGNGHVAIIIGKSGNNLVLAEANFQKDGLVRYGRTIPMDSPKIVGVGRFPFLLDLGVKSVNLAVDCFMNNYDRQWSGNVFGDISTWFNEASGGKIQTTMFPLYTEFRNWWYEAHGSGFDGAYYNVIAKSYFDSQVLPLMFTNENRGNPNAVVLAITNREWQGSVFNRPGLSEIGWYMPGTNPAQIQLTCEEGQTFNGEPLYQHVVEHELLHFLYSLNGKDDRTHYWDYQMHNLAGAFQDLDLNRIALNL